MALTMTPLKTTGKMLSDTVGSPYKGVSTIGGKGEFSLELGEVAIPGEANAISGSDITLSGTKLLGVVQTPDQLCAELDAQLTQPFLYPLTTPGDVCLMLRTTDESLPETPAAIEFSCGGEAGTGGRVGTGGAGGEAGKAGGSGEAGAGGEGAQGGSDAGGGGSDVGSGGTEAGQGGSSGQAGGGGGGAPVCPPTEFGPLSQCDSPTKSACAACFCADEDTETDCRAKWEACLADEGCSKAVYCANQGCSVAQCASLAGSGLTKALAVRTCREKVCPQACKGNGGG
ncbi:MAG: hypothetical protein NZX77_12765 [Polyangiaceae bacterium]|nr:hypothetical protein [Polyangiaceae bacterium]